MVPLGTGGRVGGPERSREAAAGATAEESRGRLAERLRARRGEIEQALLARAHAVSDPAEVGDSEYAQGLRAAIGAALDYGLAVLERGERRSHPIPAPLFTQARQAARNGVSLDTVLRRYFAGYTMLLDFLMPEIERDSGLRGADLHRLLRTQAAHFDRLVVAIADEHTREAEEAGARSAERRRAELVRGLLAGDLLDTSELGYRLESWHLGMVAAGPGAERALRALAAELDRRLLTVRPGEGVAWAWLGGRTRVTSAELARRVGEGHPEGLSLAIGEPGEGAAGWRLTHRQALAAWPIVLRGKHALARYADAPLLCSMLQDDLLAGSLHQLYLAPLAAERDGGVTLRETLHAYFEADRNVSSAAAALGVNRNTVASRLRAIETAIDRPLTTCSLELEAALRLAELTDTDPALPDPALR